MGSRPKGQEPQRRGPTPQRGHKPEPLDVDAHAEEKHAEDPKKIPHEDDTPAAPPRGGRSS